MTDPSHDPLRLLTLEDVSVWLSVSKDQVRELITNGELPFVNVGARKRILYRFKPEDIEDFIFKRRTYAVPASLYAGHEKHNINAKQVPGFRIIDFTDRRNLLNVKPQKGGRKKTPK
jgi:excisionase family DNA binding protein